MQRTSRLEIVLVQGQGQVQGQVQVLVRVVLKFIPQRVD